jgi:hypothetical protein
VIKQPTALAQFGLQFAPLLGSQPWPAKPALDVLQPICKAAHRFPDLCYVVVRSAVGPPGNNFTTQFTSRSVQVPFVEDSLGPVDPSAAVVDEYGVCRRRSTISARYYVVGVNAVP